jgi:hypothetical protein
MEININNVLEKIDYKKENELKSIIENSINRIVNNCKKIEIFYSYGYDPLNREIKGEIICDEKKFKFKCGEFLENFIIKKDFI